jgi:ComF family protein
VTSTITGLFTDFVSLIYPRFCLACQDGLAKGEEVICSRCILELPRTDFHFRKENPMYQRIFGRLPIQYALAFYHFQKGGRVQRLLHEFKYNNHPEIGQVLGRVYGFELYKSGYRSEFDAILPVPLHPVKLRRRRYNQSEEFASGLSESLHIPCISKVLLRTESTETQTRKSKLLRWQNVNEVFRVVDPEAVKNLRILLVDDVITTGSTIEACGIELLKAGCLSLSVASIAYTD